MPLNKSIQLVSVFAAASHGGNPAPIAIDATGLSDAAMQDIAREYRLESGFVLPPPAGSDCDFTFRFFVPNHEMSMCGHATLGALWLLRRAGKLPRNHVKIWTQSGIVEGRAVEGADGGIEITQPTGKISPLPSVAEHSADILDVLGVSVAELAPLPIQNACTSRVKTLIPLKSVSVLDTLRPDFAKMNDLCERIGSTGLYPYAPSDAANQVFDARQFPKSSGYPEDAATGIAAAALSFGLLANGMVAASDRTITIRQGRAMQRPSEITVRFMMKDGEPAGCWLGGQVRLEQSGATPA